MYTPLLQNKILPIRGDGRNGEHNYVWLKLLRYTYLSALFLVIVVAVASV